MKKIWKFLFGIKCRLCYEYYHVGGGQVKTPNDLLEICPNCCEVLENMSGHSR